jgi:hypothetical protein
MTPSFSTIRQWLLKIGLYKLTSPKHSPSGWFFVIDTSIQMGPQKCVVVLGIKNLDVKNNFSPKLEDAEPLVVRPLINCPGEVINEILEEAVAITQAVPLGIVTDEGAENKKGGRLFMQNHPESVQLFDASHKINNCLKNELSENPVWSSFRKEAGAAVQHLKLSSIAYLAPPRQRTKERMHCSFPLIEFGNKLLKFLDSSSAINLTESELEKIKWIRKYQFILSDYLQLEEICKHALNIVHEQGYFFTMEEEFLRRINISSDQRIRNFQMKIKEILENEGKKVPVGKNYQGSSEIIESLFGKFKAIEDNHASSGLTSLILAIPALVGKINESIVAETLKKISVEDTEDWIEKNMGQTFLSKRRKALISEKRNDHLLDLELCD